MQYPAVLSCLTLDLSEAVGRPARDVPGVVSPAHRGQHQGGWGSTGALCLTTAMTGPGRRTGDLVYRFIP